ncbi:MAG: hypothetical protein IJ446_00565 [Oscillospiraceae bacterium]|nr:hypothetical protein [Oscillospiraceae bacterium]
MSFLIYSIISLFIYLRLDILIKNEFNEKFVKAAELPELTEKQRTAEMEYIMDMLLTSFHEAMNGNELTGIDYSERADEYIERAAQAKSNIEYFYVIDAVLSEFQSAHTDLMLPDISGYPDFLNGYIASSDTSVYKYTDYWYDELKNTVNGYDSSLTRFNYCDGSYVSTESETDEFFTLVSVDGIPVDSYIKDNMSVWKINYDHVLKKAYRDSIVFDKNEGEKKVVLTLSDSSGKELTSDAYISFRAELAMRYYHLINEDNAEESDDTEEPDNYSIYCDTENDLCYIELNSMDVSTENTAFADEINNIPEDIGNVILDLRYNTGGVPDYVMNVVYPPLFYRSSIIESQSVLYKSDYTDQIVDNYSGFFKLLEEKDNEIIYAETTNYFGNSETQRNVYVLTSHMTCSAADTLSAMVKAGGAGTIIGDNTAGEGLGVYSGGYVVPLKKSGLCIKYVPFYTENPDGTSNSLYGTAPDIYSRLNVESLEKRRMISKNCEDVYSYENRLEWDNVLADTIEIINND